MSKELEALESLMGNYYEMCQDTGDNDDQYQRYNNTSEYHAIKRALEEKEKQEKLLKILKDKKVDLHLIDSIPKEDTSIYGVKAYNFCYLKHLTKEEFDIIKRWLKE